MKFQILQERLYGLPNSYTYNAAGYPEKSVDNIEGLKYTSEYFY